MDDDLRFRYQQHDGRNTAIVAVVTILAAPVIGFLGWPAAVLIGAVGGIVLYRAITKS